MEKMGGLSKIGIKKIKIFKDKNGATGGNNTHDQKNLLPFPFRSFNQEPCRVIDGDGQSKNEDVDREEGHIENPTCRQEKKPAIPGGNQKIESRHGREKNKKAKEIKKKSTPLTS